ncbi:Mss4-like protein [Mycena belliarum]|uniref:Mss4-like protein n=1 Tax=Mycena belliarum TaxID=1033014 RepID=A0AAD6XZ79_9AGAR|nr:Mss4-like protein [Mycena belliae]
MSEPTESARPIEYRGNCHCGAFKFTFKAPELKQMFACNCSICSSNGYLWVFPASSEDFVVVKGDEDSTLKSYEFAKRGMTHKFCPICGTSVMARMHKPVNGQSVAINMRALLDADFSLPVVTSDGAATDPPYQAPAPMDVGTVPEGSTTYQGHCHCGAVAYTLHSPHEIVEACECNCSICFRDGALWTYPNETNIVFRGLDSLTEYTFASGVVYHGFCKTCGVAIRERFTQPGNIDMALNVRTMTGVELSKLALEKFDGKAISPAYSRRSRLFGDDLSANEATWNQVPSLSL